MSFGGQPDVIAGVALATTSGVLAVIGLVLPAQSSDRVTREGGTVFLGETIMQRGYALAQPLVRILSRSGVSPDVISWASVGLGAAAGVALAFGHYGLAAWGLALSGLCDLLDGAVARAQQRASAAGAALDSALDRYVEFFFIAGALWWFQSLPLAQLACITALLGSFMVTYSTAKAEALRVKPPRGWMKRPERIVWLLLGATTSSIAANVWPLLSAITVIALFANVSAIRRLAALRRVVSN